MENIEEKREKKGIGFKAFGISLIILSSLNMMLSWRGGFEPGFFHPTVMAAGIAIFILGLMRGK